MESWNGTYVYETVCSPTRGALARESASFRDKVRNYGAARVFHGKNATEVVG